jgi:HD superfamily phosphodiesterase
MTDIKNLLSKSKIGSSNLREHSIDVSNIAVEIAKKTVKGSILNESNFFIENIRVTGLLKRL